MAGETESSLPALSTLASGTETQGNERARTGHALSSVLSTPLAPDASWLSFKTVLPPPLAAK